MYNLFTKVHTQESFEAEDISDPGTDNEDHGDVTNAGDKFKSKSKYRKKSSSNAGTPSKSPRINLSPNASPNPSPRKPAKPVRFRSLYNLYQASTNRKQSVPIPTIEFPTYLYQNGENLDPNAEDADQCSCDFDGDMCKSPMFVYSLLSHLFVYFCCTVWCWCLYVCFVCDTPMGLS